jgi:hypothetical protein
MIPSLADRRSVFNVRPGACVRAGDAGALAAEMSHRAGRRCQPMAVAVQLDARSATRRWVGAALFSTSAVLYLSTLSRHYSSDSCLYAVQIAARAWPAMVAPHHLLLHPLGAAWSELWRILGWTGDAMLPLQALNGLGGAACVALLFWHAVRAGASTAAAAVAASGFAVVVSRSSMR